MNKIIYIKPLDIVKWHGKKGKESFSQPVFIKAPPNPNTMMYKVKWDNEKETYKDITNPNQKLTELQYYSKLLRTDLTPVFTPNVPHPFYDSNLGTVKLTRETVILDLNNPLHYVHYKICLGSDIVANSIDDWEEGLFPDARFVIVDGTEIKKIKIKKIELKKQARKVLEKMSKKQKLDFIFDITERDLSKASDEDIEIFLDDLLESDPQAFINVKEDDNLALRTIIKKALQTKVLIRKDKSIYYFEKKIGKDIESVVDYLKDENNNELKLQIIAQTQ